MLFKLKILIYKNLIIQHTYTLVLIIMLVLLIYKTYNYRAT